MKTLRDLAQAVVDAPDDDASRVALGRWLGFPRGADPTLSVAVDILAALDAADAQGYARAMGEVVAHAEVTALGRRVAIQKGMVTGKRVPGGRALHDGANNALHAVADWARERLPAAAEKEHGG